MKHVARNGAESAFGSGRRTAGRPIGGRENGRRGDRRARRRTPRRRAPLVPRAVARLAPAAVALVALSCSSPARNASLCDEPRRTGTLPADVAESSGLAASRSHPGVFWTHNDSGDEAFVFAIDSAGRLLGRVRVTGAENHDWEDIALAPCGDDAGDCLYIADTGNNLGSREEVAIYRVPEPSPDDSATAPAERIAIRYPGDVVDTEAIYVLPDGTIYLVSKGRQAPPTLFRYPGRPRADEVVVLREVARFRQTPVGLPYQVTGADASPDGRWVAVRTYTSVQIYRVAWRGRLRPLLPDPGIDLQILAEPQGEAVAFGPDGSLVLTSEAGPSDVPGTISRIDCRLD